MVTGAASGGFFVIVQNLLKALVIQRIFSIPTDTLPIQFLKYSQELRNFYGFNVVPDGSKFTRLKSIRVNVEKSINHFKDSFCIANHKTQNEKTQREIFL